MRLFALGEGLRRCGRRGAPTVGIENAAQGQEKQQWCREPQQPCMRGEARLQQHELPIARNHEGDDVVVAVARLQPLAHQHAQIPGQGRIGIVDGLILTDQTAQPLGQPPRPRFQRRIVQDFVGLYGVHARRTECKNRQKSGEHKLAEGHRHLPAAMAGFVFCLARLGAPTRKRRSDSDTIPPKNMNKAPSQISRTIGLK